MGDTAVWEKNQDPCSAASQGDCGLALDLWAQCCTQAITWAVLLYQCLSSAGLGQGGHTAVHDKLMMSPSAPCLIVCASMCLHVGSARIHVFSL